MTRNTALTSIKSFLDLLNNPQNLHKQNVKVYNAIRTHGPVCNRDITRITGIELGSVSRTANTLKKLGVIKCAYERTYEPTGKEAQYWCIAEVMEPTYKLLERQQAAEERKTYGIYSRVKKLANPAQLSLGGLL